MIVEIILSHTSVLEHYAYLSMHYTSFGTAHYRARNDAHGGCGIRGEKSKKKISK